MQGHFTITLMYCALLWYIHKVYRPILKRGNLPMKHIRTDKGIGRGVKIQFQGVYGDYQRCQLYCSVKYWSQPTIQRTFHVLKKCTPIKRLCPFKLYSKSCITVRRPANFYKYREYYHLNIYLTHLQPTRPPPVIHCQVLGHASGPSSWQVSDPVLSSGDHDKCVKKSIHSAFLCYCPHDTHHNLYYL